MNIGIFQGRLSDSDILQKFPSNWQQEFFAAKVLGYSHIEIFLEEKINKQNPFWNKKEREKIKKKILTLDNKKIILCDNFVIRNDLYQQSTLKYLNKIINILCEFNNPKLIIPIDKNYFKDIDKLSKFLNNLSLLSKNKGVELSYEIDAKYNSVLSLFKKLKFDNVGITFDAGNIFLSHKNLIQYFRKIYKHINHIHIKDRNIRGENVILGTGLINFLTLFKEIKYRKYSGDVTLETFRKKNSIIQAHKNLHFLKSLYKKRY